MAGWRDNLRPASFRGVPFFVEGHQESGGRHGALHQFPGRDVPYWEDLGGKAGEYRISAYVIGDDYAARRDALRKALKAPGPGPLIHPYLGAFSAAGAPHYILSETKGRGGMATFFITFVEAGENLFPASAANRRQIVADAADSCADAAGDAFADVFLVEDKPAFVADGSQSFVETFLGDLVAGARGLRADIAGVWDVVTRIDAAIADVGELVRLPFDLVVQLRDLASGFAGLIPAGLFALRPLLELAGWGEEGEDAAAAVTASRQRLATNRDATIRLVRRLFTAEAARALTLGGFEALDDALAARDLVVAAIDAEIDAAGANGEHDVFVAFSDLRTEAVRYINEESARLPRLRTWTPPTTMPAVLIAWRIYGDATRAGEIAARNRIRHPGFVPGGVPLQVLDA